jgi:hypothetical protein
VKNDAELRVVDQEILLRTEALAAKLPDVDALRGAVTTAQEKLDVAKSARLKVKALSLVGLAGKKEVGYAEDGLATRESQLAEAQAALEEGETAFALVSGQLVPDAEAQARRLVYERIVAEAKTLALEELELVRELLVKQDRMDVLAKHLEQQFTEGGRALHQLRGRGPVLGAIRYWGAAGPRPRLSWATTQRRLSIFQRLLHDCGWS